MNEKNMTKKDVEKQIEKEERYLIRCKEKIVDIESDIRCTKNAIKMWKSYLKKIEKKGV